MSELSFENLAPGWQRDLVKRIAPLLWTRKEVQALWIVGSLARGEADSYSDVDLWMSIEDEAIPSWKEMDVSSLFGSDYLASRLFQVSERSFLFSVTIKEGRYFDLGVQSAKADPASGPALQIGSKSQEFTEKLKRTASQQQQQVKASKEHIESLIRNYWVNTLKHSKVIRRGFEVVAIVGLNMERSLLLQLWYVAETGLDPRHTFGITVHGLMEQAEAAQRLRGAKVRQLIAGDALTDFAGITKAIEDIRDEVSSIGRQLSRSLGFDYPESLEQTVRESWVRFKSEHP